MPTGRDRRVGKRVLAGFAVTTFDPAAAGWEVRSIPGFADMVGPLWRKATADGILYGMQIAEKHKNLGGVAHGGVLATLLDTALGSALAEADPARRQVTVSLDIQYLAPAKIGDFVIVDVEVTRAARSLTFVRGVARASGQACASAHGVWKVLR